MVAAMEPPRGGAESLFAAGLLLQLRFDGLNTSYWCAAAMEPPEVGRSHCSQELSRLTCGYSTGCERRVGAAGIRLLCGVVKMRIRPSTWVRALAGDSLFTLALAHSDDDCACGRQSFVVADEQELAGISGKS